MARLKGIRAAFGAVKSFAKRGKKGALKGLRKARKAAGRHKGKAALAGGLALGGGGGYAAGRRR